MFASFACSANRSMDEATALRTPRHLEVGGMSGRPVSVATPTNRLIGSHQARLACLPRINHDVRWPVVSAGPVTRLALNAGKSSRPGRMAGQTRRRLVLGRQTGRGESVRGRGPAIVDGPVAEPATLGAHERCLVGTHAENTAKQKGPTGSGSIGSHVFLSIRLARAVSTRQGMGFPPLSRSQGRQDA